MVVHQKKKKIEFETFYSIFRGIDRSLQRRGRRRSCHQQGPVWRRAHWINEIMLSLLAHGSSFCLQTNAINKRERKSPEIQPFFPPIRFQKVPTGVHHHHYYPTTTYPSSYPLIWVHLTLSSSSSSMSNRVIFFKYIYGFYLLLITWWIFPTCCLVPQKKWVPP